MIELISIIVLSLLLLGQAIERYFYAKDMTQKLNDSIKAVMSRNINEYIAAVSAEKVNNVPFKEPDEVLLETVDDEVFDKFIKKQTQ
jgi:hypothetical protein